MNPDPQTGGLFSFLNRMRKPNSATGLSPIQNFAQALDPLILPSMRGGEAIRAQGQQRLAEGNKNKTIQFLRGKASEGETIAQQILGGLENNSLSVKDAMALYYNQTFAKPKESFTTMTGAKVNEMMGSNLPESALFNVSSTGKVSQVGGAGTTLNVNTAENKGAEKFAQLDAQSLIDVSKAGVTAGSTISKINRLEQLLSQTQTGPAAALAYTAGNFGIQTEGLSELQAAQALINALVPAQRPAGSGPMSDADLELFKQSLPRLINTPDGNRLIIATLRGVAEYDRQGAEIVQKYRNKEISEAEAFQQLLNRKDPFAATDVFSLLPEPDRGQ